MDSSEFQGYLHYRQSELLTDVRDLRSRLGDVTDDDVIVGVTRGGLVPAVMLSHLTGLDVVPVKFSFREKSVPEVDEPTLLSVVRSFRRIFIVDDICQSGLTFQSMLGSIRHNLGSDELEHVCTISLFYDVSGGYKPCLYARTIDRTFDKRYVVFPWELS